MVRTVLLTVALTLVIGVAMVVDTRSRLEVPEAPPPRSAAPARIFAPGRIEGATAEVALKPRIHGRIDRILVEEGQSVEPGQVLIALDDREYRQEVALAAAEKAVAQSRLQRLVNGARTEERQEAEAIYRARLAELEQARLAWERTSNLREVNAVSQQEADNQRTQTASLAAQVDAAKARRDLLLAPARADEVLISQTQIDAANARWELAKVELSRTQLQSPGRLRVLQVNIEVGELAGPDMSEPAIVLADTSRYRARAFVEELDAPRVQVGMPATVSADGLGDTKIAGRVSRISPRMGRKAIWSERPDERYDTKTREVWIDLEEGYELVLGLRVDVVIECPAENDGT